MKQSYKNRLNKLLLLPLCLLALHGRSQIADGAYFITDAGVNSFTSYLTPISTNGTGTFATGDVPKWYTFASFSAATTNQEWLITQIGSTGVYTIQTLVNSLYLNSQDANIGSSSTAGSPLTVVTATSGNKTLWTFTVNGTNVEIHNQSSNGCLNATAGNPATAGYASQYSCANPGQANLFKLTLASSVLPITLTGFSATVTNCTANLVWQTAMEVNSNHYDIELSTDGTNFSKVGEIASKNSGTGATYTFACALKTGINYFRLKAVDIDGTFNYSAQITAIGTGACSAGIFVKVSPNPTSNTVSIQGLAIGSYLSLLNMSGQKMVELIVTSTNQAINLSNYAKGVYILHAQSTTGSINNVKVIKN